MYGLGDVNLRGRIWLQYLSESPKTQPKLIGHELDVGRNMINLKEV
jgi:hypothetical protein